LVWVNLEHVSGPPCRLDGELTLSLEEEGSLLPNADNNPATIQVTSALGVGETFIAKWPLHGCGAARHATDVARFGGLVGSAKQGVCAGDGRPGLALPGDVSFSPETSKRDYERALARASG
jgi:hypothetical protein